MTRLRIPTQLDELPAGDYEVLYVRPAAGELQIATSKLSLGQKEKPRWDALQVHPGVRIECANCRDWYAVDEIPVDEVPGWRCPDCRSAST
ncbi:MAG TPA: hypothetical protein VLJ76_06090 [Gaiellaceae bacterium]|nr:hypothetical protein [Gaiellaceae bacterium]